MKDQEIARITFFTFFIHSKHFQLKLESTQKDKNILYILYQQKLFMTINGEKTGPTFICVSFLFLFPIF